MTGKQRAVLWIGLILVGLTVVQRWHEIASVIFNGAGITDKIVDPGSGGPDPFQLPPDPFKKAKPQPKKVQIV